MVNKCVLIINKLTRQNEDFTTEKIEHLKALTKSDHTSAVADHIKTNFHNINCVCFLSGKTDFHCKIKETLLIQELQPSLNVYVSRKRLMLY